VRRPATFLPRSGTTGGTTEKPTGPVASRPSVPEDIVGRGGLTTGRNQLHYRLSTTQLSHFSDALSPGGEVLDKEREILIMYETLIEHRFYSFLPEHPAQAAQGIGKTRNSLRRTPRLNSPGTLPRGQPPIPSPHQRIQPQAQRRRPLGVSSFPSLRLLAARQGENVSGRLGAHAGKSTDQGVLCRYVIGNIHADLPRYKGSFSTFCIGSSAGFFIPLLVLISRPPNALRKCES